jgi:hypothetical protein
MPFVQAPDRTQLYFEEVGTGSTVISFTSSSALAELFFAAESGRWLAHKKAT